MFFRTLSGRFLLLSFIFVMLAEIVIFVPSVARYRISYLQERLERAQLASLALLATPDDMVSPELEGELLDNAEVLNIVLQRDEIRELILSKPIPKPILRTYDLRETTLFSSIRDAIACIIHDEEEIIRVIGRPVKQAGLGIEVVMEEDFVKASMLDYARNILLLSLGISIVTGLLLFVALQLLIARPIKNVITSMINFRNNPEDVSSVIEPSSRITELHEAENALSELQHQLIASLRQKERLAQLGGAVSKVSHDLRNILTTTQILADTFEGSEDPKVKRMAPKLIKSLERGINLCERTLTFGKAEEREPIPELMALKPLVDTVIENDQLRVDISKVQYISTVGHEIKVYADQEQLFRVLTNLIRNARQAMEDSGKRGVITIEANEIGTGTEIIIRDTGPGIPPSALEFLFRPFQGSARKGGTGLGLTISAEIIKGHGGALELVKSDAEGTTFRIFLPKTRK